MFKRSCFWCDKLSFELRWGKSDTGHEWMKPFNPVDQILMPMQSTVCSLQELTLFSSAHSTREEICARAASVQKPKTVFSLVTREWMFQLIRYMNTNFTNSVWSADLIWGESKLLRTENVWEQTLSKGIFTMCTEDTHSKFWRCFQRGLQWLSIDWGFQG